MYKTVNFGQNVAVFKKIDSHVYNVILKGILLSILCLCPTFFKNISRHKGIRIILITLKGLTILPSV